MSKRIIAVAVGLVLALVVGPLSAHARYLNPDTGRFQTMDSYEGNSREPLSLHKYLYCLANPANRIDISGNDSIGDILMVLDIYASLRHDWSKPSNPIPKGGVGGPDVTKALNRTLQDVEMNFLSWPKNQKLLAAIAMRDPSTAGAAWDILQLMSVGFGDVSYLETSKHAMLVTGVGPWSRTVAFNNRVYYAGAVNYAIWGKMNRLCHDFLTLEGGFFGPKPVSYCLNVAKDTVSSWKHFKYDDYGETSKQAEAFTEYGFEGNLPSAGLPCKPSGQVFDDKFFDWCWEPNKPRPQ